MAKTLFRPVSFELSQLLGDIDLGKLALPELQRPFVWKKRGIRDLLDSMYRGFPIGYLMLWNAAEIDSKFIGTDGKQHADRVHRGWPTAPDGPVCRDEGGRDHLLGLQ
jgi:Protein of unknown function DUF262